MNAIARGPFATAALELQSYGLAPIPCGGDDGKLPGIRTKNWKAPPGTDALRELVHRFQHENIGILTGPSHVTVVDIDDANLTADMIHRFGNTPLAVATPSGGLHLYFRSSGERCTNLRKPEGLPVDIKARGGFVVVPPSVRPSGPHAGRAYSFAEGSWSDLERLPALKPGSLPGAPTARPAARQEHARPGPIHEGTRHNELVRHALSQASHCDSFDALLDKVHWINECCLPPLPHAEVVKLAVWAWQCEEKGGNFIGSERRVFTTVTEHEALKRLPHGPDAMILLAELRFTHYGGRPFALAPHAIAAAGVIPGWAHQRYRDARALLLEIGSIVVVHRGGRGQGDPQLFAFAPHKATPASIV